MQRVAVIDELMELDCWKELIVSSIPQFRFRDGGDIDSLVICIRLLDFFGVDVAEVVAFDEVKAFDEVEVEAFDIVADDVVALTMLKRLTLSLVLLFF